MKPSIVRIVLCVAFLSFIISSCQQATGSGFEHPEPGLTPITRSQNQPAKTPKPTLTSFPTPLPAITNTSDAPPVINTVTPTEIILPILMYHHVSSEIKNSRYAIDPEVFKTQMEWLRTNGYITMTVSDLAKLLTSGGDLPKKPVIITFDDGYTDVFSNAYPVMKRLGLKGTFYIIAGDVDQPANISTSQLLRLVKHGWEIGSHSMTHIDLNQTQTDLETEIISSKQILEEKLGISILSFSYPYGLGNLSVMEFTRKAGYTSAVGLGAKRVHSPSTLFYLSRIEVQGSLTLDEFINLVEPRQATRVP